MAFLHPDFSPSKDCRDLARRTALLGILVCALQLYVITVKDIPGTGIVLNWSPAVTGVPALSASTLLAIVTAYNYLVFVGQYVGEYAVFNELDMQSSSAALKENIESIKSAQGLPEDQIALSLLSGSRMKNYRAAKFASYVRFFAEILMPTALFIACLCLEGPNMIALIRYLV